MSKQTQTKSTKENIVARDQAHSPEQDRRPASVDPYADILNLQRAGGNQAVNQLLSLGPIGQSPAVNGGPPIVQEVLRSGNGQPLDPEMRQFMEARFGYNFSQIRIHSDPRATESAKLVNAEAYTIGAHVVLGTEPLWGTQAGQHMLAHELAHVIQQSRRGGTTPPPLLSSGLEQAADQAASAVTQGSRPVQVFGASAPGLARQPRALSQSLNPSTLTDEELKHEIALIRQWLQENPYPSSEHDLLARTLFALELHAANRQVIGYHRSGISGQQLIEMLGKKGLDYFRQSPVSTVSSLPSSASSSPVGQLSTPQVGASLMNLLSKTPEFGLPIKFAQGAAGFTSGFLEGAAFSVQDAFPRLEAELGQWDNRLLFNLGTFAGFHWGLLKDLKDNIVGLAELGVAASPIGAVLQIKKSIEELSRFTADPAGYMELELEKLRGLLEFLYHVETDPGFLLEQGEKLGFAVGYERGSSFSEDFMNMHPFMKGLTVGEVIGYIVMEILLFLIPPEWLVKGALAAAEIAKGTRIGKAVLEVLERMPGISGFIKAQRAAEIQKASSIGRAAGVLKPSPGAAQAGKEAEQLRVGQAVAPKSDVTPPRVKPAQVEEGRKVTKEVETTSIVGPEAKVKPEAEKQAKAPLEVAPTSVEPTESSVVPLEGPLESLGHVKIPAEKVKAKRPPGFEPTAEQRKLPTKAGEFRKSPEFEPTALKKPPGPSPKGKAPSWAAQLEGLKLNDDQARRLLRKNMGPALPGHQGHHIIPYEHRYHPVVQEAALDAGWDINGKSNGIDLPTSRIVEGAENKAIHYGSHPEYSAMVEERLNEIQKIRGTPEQKRSALEALSEELRGKLERGEIKLE